MPYVNFLDLIKSIIIFSETNGGNVEEITEGEHYPMQVHGRTPLSTVAIQVPLKASSLNTNDCFVLVAKKETWVWMGKGATGDEREVSKKVGEEAHTSNDTNVVFEGQEKEQFWNLLGGKGPYNDERVFGKHDTPDNFIPRLFHGSNATGTFKGKIYNEHYVNVPIFRYKISGNTQVCLMLIL